MRNNPSKLAFTCFLCTFLMLANVRGTTTVQVLVSNDGEIIYPPDNLNSTNQGSATNLTIPTELYICVPRRSSNGPFLTNIWANLIRKDTGEGIGGKRLLSFLDDVNVSVQYTAKETGYAGPFDINPKTVGLHRTWVEFPGDTEFEPCESEEIILKVDPNLTDLTEHTMEVTPVSGDAPLTIQVTGFIGMYPKKPIGYSLPLDLMVFDKTSTKTLQPVKSFMSNPDGTYTIEYTFAKPGSYSIFVNFLGDDKYRSDWSNDGETTVITGTVR